MQFIRRYALLSLTVFIFCGGCLGAGAWWAIRHFSKPSDRIFVEQPSSAPTPRPSPPTIAMPASTAPTRVPTRQPSTHTSADPLGTLSALGWTIKRDSSLLTFEIANKTLPSMVESTGNFAQLHESFRIHLQNVPSLDGLEKLWGNEKCVEIELAASDLTSIAPLSGFKSLQKLTISQTPINTHANLDSSPLQGLVNLRSLNLYGSRFSDLAPFRSMKDLNSLSIGNTLIRDLSPISSLKKLKNLNVRDSQIVDVSPVSANTRLEELEIGSNQLRSLGALSSLQNLHKLTVIGQTMDDLSPIGKLPHLTDLFVWGPPLMNLSFLNQLPNLENLQLTGFNRFTGQRSQVVGIESLCTSRNLKTLTLGFLEISALDFVGRCSELLEINLNYMPIASLGGLTNMQSVKRVSLIDVPLAEISPLLTLPNLEGLSLIRVPARADIIALLERKGVKVQNP